MPESYRKGLQEIAAIDPEAGPAFVEELKRISPDFADYFVGFAFGKIHARTVLEPQIKELITVAILIAIPDGRSHLRLHIQAAIRAGCTKEEIIEVIIQSIVHVGFTKALIALHLAKEVYEEGETSKPPADGRAGT
jgi:4-carboxymuconolactone decarboxylase